MKQDEKKESQKTAEEYFDQFADACGYDCCQEHRDAARKVFLSGFSAALRFFSAVAHEVEQPDAVAERMHAIHEELATFAIEMLARQITGNAIRAKLPSLPMRSNPGTINLPCAISRSVSRNAKSSTGQRT